MLKSVAKCSEIEYKLPCVLSPVLSYAASQYHIKGFKRGTGAPF